MLRFHRLRVSLWNLMRSKNEAAFYLATTFQSRLLAWLAGVELGKRSVFYGNAKFQKSADAKISIGDQCIFRSSPTSNLIGINRPCIITAFKRAQLQIGDSCGFSGTVLGCFHRITIGDKVRCGANTLITDSDWHEGDPRTSDPRPVVIEDNVWLGVNSIVLKGSKIGRNSVIGAGSIVTGEIPPNVIAAGTPCKVIKTLQ
ncbi:MAG: acyltransferase [Planctomycetota bacterium]|jgi:acetyltransferase-like isoleucine patch superfamily enzyme